MLPLTFFSAPEGFCCGLQPPVPVCSFPHLPSILPVTWIHISDFLLCSLCRPPSFFCKTMRNTLRKFLRLSRPLHSVSVVTKQAPLALSNAKVSCKYGLWLVARINKKNRLIHECRFLGIKKLRSLSYD